MKKLALLVALTVYTANAGEVYKLLVNIKDKVEETKLKSLGFSQCKSINQNTLICLESEDRDHLLRLRDFLISQNISAKVVASKEEPRENKTSLKESKTNIAQTDTFKKDKFLIKQENYEYKKDDIKRQENIPTKQTIKPQSEKIDLVSENLRAMYLYLNSGNFDKAREIANSLLNTKYSIEAKFALGLIELKKENFKNACNIFSSLKTLKKEAKDLERDSCWVYYMQEGYNNLENENLSMALSNFEKSLSYKENIESKIGIYYVLLKQKKLDMAEKIIKELYHKNPDNPKIRRAYIDFLIEAKDFSELQKFEAELTETEKQLIENQTLYSQLEKVSKLIKDREFEFAEKILKELYLKYPSNIYVLLNLGYLYLEKGELFSAENFYKNALFYDKNNKEALKGLKAVYVKLGKYEEALNVINNLKNIGVKEEDELKIKELYYIEKAQQYLKEKNLVLAENFAKEALKINSNNAVAYLILSNVYKEKSDEGNYFKYISKAFELQPENFGIKLAYMYALANLDMYEQVKILLENINKHNLSSDEKEELKQFYRVLYYRLASYYLNNKDYIKAKKTAIEGLEIFKVDSGLLEVLGWSCYNLKDYECSRKAFENVISLKPDDDMSKLGLAYTYLNLNEKQKLNNILKSIENSSNPEVLKGLANIYMSLGRYTDAEKIINKIEKVNNNLSEVKRDIKEKSLEKVKPKIIEREIPFILDEDVKDINPSKNIIHKQYKIEENSYNDIVEEKSKDQELEEIKKKIRQEKQNYTSYAEIGVKFRDKSGESGKSKLTDTSPYLLINYFLNEKVNIYAGSYFTNLNSGTLSDYKNFGTPQNETIQRQVPSSYTGAEPFIGMNIENENFLISSFFSSTPIVNNDIKSSVTYSLEGKVKTEDSKIGIGLYKKPIRDSILSYVGTLDPYTTKTSWGRATEDGVKISFEKSIEENLIYSEVNIGKIKGKDIEDNNHINFIFMPKFYVGNYLSDKDYIGLFLMYDKFSKDQDCYYYGCGGYFSPKNLMIFAPMIEGYKFLTQNFGFHYKAFLGLLNMNNKGKNSMDTSFDGYIGGIYKVADNIFLNLAGEYRKTSKYNEIFSSLYLQYFFGNRFNITEKDLLKQEKELYKR